MKLKRYTNTELIELCSNLFYDWMASPKKDDTNLTNADEVHKYYLDEIALYKSRIAMLENAINDPLYNKIATDLRTELDILSTGLNYLVNMNLKNQVETYCRTKSCNYSRSSVQISLNKRINSYYDDFILNVTFYDDVCTPQGKYNDYIKLISKEERIEFLKVNTQITHLCLVYEPSPNKMASIAIAGKFNFDKYIYESYGEFVLPSKFSDFENLTLTDISKLKNNDLKQFLQSKIDLDKEDMKCLASVNIRGDVYKIYLYFDKDSYKDELYIRYICRSTARVYYNRLNLNNLKIS